MYLDDLPIPAALSDSGRPLPRHPALSLEYFHRTDHRRRQRAQPIGLSQCTANCEKRPQRSPLARLKMPVRTKGNAASFGNCLLRQITLKAKSANRIADLLHHSGHYIISHNLHFYNNQRRILYSIIIIMSIVPKIRINLLPALRICRRFRRSSAHRQVHNAQAAAPRLLYFLHR